MFIELIKEKLQSSKGKIFTVTFIKKDGTMRVMNCRLGVKKNLKGVGRRYNPDNFNLLSVYDMQKKAYRMINLETIQEIKIGGQVYAK